MANKLTASTLRIILFAGLILLIGGGTAGFVLIRAKLIEKADASAKVNADAISSQNKVQDLKNAQAALTANEETEKKVQAMVASSHQYNYQDQIVEAVTTLGASASVRVTNIDFVSTSQVGAPAPPVQGGASAAQVPATNIPTDIKLTQANVTVATPVRYDNLLRFIRYVEQNTMTMKVSKLSISRTDSTENGQMLVNCDVLTIGVYMR